MVYDGRETSPQCAWMGAKRSVVTQAHDFRPTVARRGGPGRAAKVRKWAKQIEREKKSCAAIVETSQSVSVGRAARAATEERWGVVTLVHNALGFILEAGRVVDEYADLDTLEAVVATCVDEEEDDVYIA